MNGQLLVSDAYRADLTPLLLYQAALGLPVRPADRYPAVLPFAPATGRDAEMMATAGIDMQRTVAVGLEIDVVDEVWVGDELTAVARKLTDEVTEAGRRVDIRTEFRREGQLVRRWTLHLLELP